MVSTPQELRKVIRVAKAFQEADRDTQDDINRIIDTRLSNNEVKQALSDLNIKDKYVDEALSVLHPSQESIDMLKGEFGVVQKPTLIGKVLLKEFDALLQQYPNYKIVPNPDYAYLDVKFKVSEKGFMKKAKWKTVGEFRLDADRSPEFSYNQNHSKLLSYYKPIIEFCKSNIRGFQVYEK
jgi:hypothetical protein